jgi:tetratricopeptide (TPR) repeat protein
MPIEGPLRELDIHDVFQLLDLSRKTGALRVTTRLGDNEGTVYFDGGQVIYAAARNNPHPLGAMLVRSGRLTEAELARARARQVEGLDGRRLGQILVAEGYITPRELDRQLRLQIESVVFELLSWREGFFSFAEQEAAAVPAEATVRISAESLLMESARRADEWSTIADRVPSLDVVPALSPGADDDAPQLDLQLDEWELLAAVDGARDLRAIAGVLGRSEFDVAKLAARLVRSRVLRLDARGRETVSGVGAEQAARARRLLELGDAEGALAEARLGSAADPGCAPARAAAAAALDRLGRHREALEELRRAATLDADDRRVLRALGFAAARVGELAEAAAAWRGCLGQAPTEGDETLCEALAAVERLREVLDAHAAA